MTFLISGLWHLLLLRVLSWDAVAQIGLAFAIFGASVAVLVQLSHIWPRVRGAAARESYRYSQPVLSPLWSA